MVLSADLPDLPHRPTISLFRSAAETVASPSPTAAVTSADLALADAMDALVAANDKFAQTIIAHPNKAPTERPKVPRADSLPSLKKALKECNDDILRADGGGGSCPSKCKSPHVHTGGKHNGGITLRNGVCTHWSSRPYGGRRYCGPEIAKGPDPDAYTKGGIDCRPCRKAGRLAAMRGGPQTPSSVINVSIVRALFAFCSSCPVFPYFGEESRE